CGRRAGRAAHRAGWLRGRPRGRVELARPWLGEGIGREDVRGAAGDPRDAGGRTGKDRRSGLARSSSAPANQADDIGLATGQRRAPAQYPRAQLKIPYGTGLDYMKCRSRPCVSGMRHNDRQALASPHPVLSRSTTAGFILNPGGFAPAAPLTRSLVRRFDAALRSRGLAPLRSLAAARSLWSVACSPCRPP